MDEELIYREAYPEEWEEAMSLAWRVFLRFDAPDYSPLGIKNFNNFVLDDSLRKMFHNGGYKLFCAFEGEKMVGIISLREEHHISLLFVEEDYQKKGIGAKLIEYMANYVRAELYGDYMTVNSSPSAVGFYHRMGFCDTGVQTVTDGIAYTPMRYLIR